MSGEGQSYFRSASADVGVDAIATGYVRLLDDFRIKVADSGKRSIDIVSSYIRRIVRVINDGRRGS